jgi:transposase
MSKKLDMEISKQITQLYDQGFNGPCIAKKLNIGETTVYKYLKNAGTIPMVLIKNRIRNRIGLFTPIQDKEIACLYLKEKLGLKKIAGFYNCCPDAIKNALKREKVIIKSRGNKYRDFTQNETDDIIKRYNQGESQSSIAKSFNAHQTTISGHLANHGIKSRRKIARGRNHGMWKNGIITVSGYHYVRYLENDRFKSMVQRSGYVAEHRIVMAKKLGRPLLPHETVHHIDGDKLNNDPENLELHQTRHGNGFVCRCADCGSTNIVFDNIKSDT